MGTDEVSRKLGRLLAARWPSRAPCSLRHCGRGRWRVPGVPTLGRRSMSLVGDGTSCASCPAHGRHGDEALAITRWAGAIVNGPVVRSIGKAGFLFPAVRVVPREPSFSSVAFPVFGRGADVSVARSDVQAQSGVTSWANGTWGRAGTSSTTPSSTRAPAAAAASASDRRLAAPSPATSSPTTTSAVVCATVGRLRQHGAPAICSSPTGATPATRAPRSRATHHEEPGVHLESNGALVSVEGEFSDTRGLATSSSPTTGRLQRPAGRSAAGGAHARRAIHREHIELTSPAPRPWPVFALGALPPGQASPSR
jgi:hypothetical protein